MYTPLSLFCFAFAFILEHPQQLESSPLVIPNADEYGPGMANDNPLTSHVLDTAVGRPAVGVKVILYKEDGGQWRKISEQLTNADGRIGNIIAAEEFTPAIYKMTFHTLSYYQARGEKTFYPFIDVVFEIERPEEHYHVPILLSAYGFSTYRGS